MEMHISDCSLSGNDGCVSPRSSGPLPKSDSVQSLVSLINCPPNPSVVSSDDDCTIRGIDGDANTHVTVVTAETDFISMSGLGLKTLSLSSLDSSSASHGLKEVSVAANALEFVDLAPLSSCPLLTVLSLNSNRISSIDLGPLAAFKKLERLWLHDNRLESIDLSPLVSCSSLRSLYLEDNSLNETSLDLSALSATRSLRSLRLGGNRLGGQLNLTPLLDCPALSVFNVDSSVSLVSDGEASQARVSSALRRIVLDVKFTGRPVGDKGRVVKRRTTPPVTRAMGTSAVRTRRRTSSSSNAETCSSPPVGKVSEKGTVVSPIVKVLLVGFRRLARYAAEDSFTRCGKIMIRASSQDVASREPRLLLDSHLVILYAPSEKTVRQVMVAVGRTPTVVVGTERYRSTADNCMLDLLDRFNFYADPLDSEDTRRVYNMGREYAMGLSDIPSANASSVDLSSALSSPDSSPVSEEENESDVRLNSRGSSGPIRKSLSENCLNGKFGGMDIDLEDIEDVEENVIVSKNATALAGPDQIAERSRYSVGGNLRHRRASDHGYSRGFTWKDVSRRLRDGKSRRGGQGWDKYDASDMGMHGRNKLRAERSAVEVSFADLGGYAKIDSCASIARSCGLPKCAGPVLFQAAFGSAFEIESTTPEAGVSNPTTERKTPRISGETFLSYWEARLKAFDGEQRLSNILRDFYHSQHTNTSTGCGHSRYGARAPKKSQSEASIFTNNAVSRLSDCSNTVGRGRSFPSQGTNRQQEGGLRVVPADISCPCDAGIEALITAFMGGRSSRFGSFALVKMSEAIAIGSALVMYGVRGASKNRVGGRARAVCPKEVREGKLNAALVAAEVGIFEGVASGLSMDQIRLVKGCFATEASPAAISRSCGLALNYTLSINDVQSFCLSRKALLPGAVEKTMAAHCLKPQEMTLSEFAIFLSVLHNLSSNGAIDYFFTVVDVDGDDHWSLPDLRHFHMEKEDMWRKDGMAVSDLVDIWVNFNDMIRPSNPSKGISRRDFFKLCGKERKIVLQSLLFVDDDHSLLNIRRTMELNKDAASPLAI